MARVVCREFQTTSYAYEFRFLGTTPYMVRRISTSGVDKLLEGPVG